MDFSSIEEAIAEIKAGKIVIVVDDPDRENEGDLIMAGEKCTAEAMNFMVKFGRGVPFIPTTAERLERGDGAGALLIRQLLGHFPHCGRQCAPARREEWRRPAFQAG